MLLLDSPEVSNTVFLRSMLGLCWVYVMEQAMQRLVRVLIASYGMELQWGLQTPGKGECTMSGGSSVVMLTQNCAATSSDILSGTANCNTRQWSQSMNPADMANTSTCYIILACTACNTAFDLPSCPLA